jgi:multiple sugar transport system permease protein
MTATALPPATTAPRTATATAYKRQKRVTALVFLVLPLTLLFVFSYLPALNMLRYSFAQWDGFGPIDKWVGFQNYIDIFTSHNNYFAVLGVSLYYFVGSIVQLTLALYFATLLSFKVRFKGFFKGILVFPSLINGVAIGFTFLIFFQGGGTLDTVVQALGVKTDDIPLWLGDRRLINISLTAVSVWRYFGLNLIWFLGAIQSIDPDLYEASALDGASRWGQFRYIIFPGIRPTIALASILSVSGALSVFEIPYVMTQGLNGSTTFVIQTVNLAFKLGQVGLASAMGIVLLILIIVVTVIQNVALGDPENRRSIRRVRAPLPQKEAA